MYTTSSPRDLSPYNLENDSTLTVNFVLVYYPMASPSLPTILQGCPEFPEAAVKSCVLSKLSLSLPCKRGFPLYKV